MKNTQKLLLSTVNLALPSGEVRLMVAGELRARLIGGGDLSLRLAEGTKR